MPFLCASMQSFSIQISNLPLFLKKLFTGGLVSALSLLLALSSPSVIANNKVTLQVGVTYDFDHTLRHILGEFIEKNPNQYNKPVFTVGTSSEIAEQLNNGKNFDIIFLNDRTKAIELERAGKLLSGSRKTFAYGRLAYWHDAPYSIAPYNIANHIIATNSSLFVAEPKETLFGARIREYLDDEIIYDQAWMQGRVTFEDKVTTCWAEPEGHDHDASHHDDEEECTVYPRPAFVPASFVIHGDEDHDVNEHVDHYTYPPESEVTAVPDDLFKPIVEQLAIPRNAPHYQEAEILSNYVLSNDIQKYIGDHGYYLADHYENMSSEPVKGCASVAAAAIFSLLGGTVLGIAIGNFVGIYWSKNHGGYAFGRFPREPKLISSGA